MIRRLVPLALAATLSAAAPPAAAPPAVITPHVHDGHFDPGDYRWMRGAFADAGPADKAAWQTVVDWRTRCMAEQEAAIRSQLAARGVKVTQPLHITGNGLCGEVGYAAPHTEQRVSWAEFDAALTRARPVATAIIWSAALAQQSLGLAEPDEAAELIARPVTDQVLRAALAWQGGDTPGAPSLDPAAQGAAEGPIWLAIGKRDHDNTAWLKTLVAAHGWPTIARVGVAASRKAWLLVQHADDDPVFQLDMLRLMEPLATRGEVAKSDYAYLYDRVMLPLTGKQRYGSQLTCAGGRYVPLPLEDAGALDARRRSMGMDPIADYLAQMVRVGGPCPADVIPPSSPAR